MQIPDLLESGSASLFVAKVSFRRQGKDDEETQLGRFDVTIDFSLDLKDHLVDGHPGYLPGAGEIVRRAKDGHGTTNIDHVPLDERRAVRLSLQRGEQWQVVTDAGAEVRKLRVIATKDSARFIAKVKITGLSSEEVGRLLECDQRSCELEFEPVQLSMAAK